MARVLLLLFLFSASACAFATSLYSTSAPYFLPENKTDSCYDEPYISDRAECVERLGTLYYGNNFSFNCPNMIHWLVKEKCKGCPWDKINASAITPAISRNLNYSELFHAAAPSCSLAQHLKDIPSGNTYLYLCFFGFALPMFCAIFLGKSDAMGSPATPQVFGSKVKEPIYFVFLWVLFFFGYGISIAGNEIYDVCHDFLSFASLQIGGWVNLAMMVWTSLWRCRYMKARDRPQEVLSWASYRASVLYKSRSIWNKRLVDTVCGAGLALVLLSVVFDTKFDNGSLTSVCQMGSYESIPYGLTQYSKIVVGILAVGVYSLGPPRRPILFYTRYLFLVIIMLVSVCHLYLMRLPAYEPQCLSKLIPHVADCEIAGPVHAGLVAHSFAVALLGVAEPLRLGWPKRGKLGRGVEDIMSLNRAEVFRNGASAA